MKLLATISAVALALGASAPAFAQHVAPAGVAFVASGPASLNGAPCTLTLNANTNAGGTGGTITGGSNTGAGICPLITIDSGAVYTMKTYNPAGNGSGTADLTGLVVRVGGVVTCTQSAPITVTITNRATPPGGATLAVSGAIGACNVAANLTSATVHVTS